LDNAQAECEQAQFLAYQCVILDYESASTVVLSREVLLLSLNTQTPGYFPDAFICKAVDGLK
jgi:hypothetical protein